jgi:hypothetical protein
VLADEFQEVRSITGLADDLVAGPVEQAREAFAEEDVVVGDNDPAGCIRGRIDDAPTLRVPSSC